MIRVDQPVPEAYRDPSGPPCPRSLPVIPSRRRTAAVCLLAALSSTPAAATELLLGHYATDLPASVTLTLATAGEPAQSVRLAYGEHAVVPFAAGERELAVSARYVDGTVVATRIATIYDTDATLVLAGSIVAPAGHEILVANEPRLPVDAASHVVRVSNLASPEVPSLPVVLRFDDEPTAPMRFGLGFENDAPIAVRPVAASCTATLAIEGAAVETARYDCTPGGRVRLFAIGDGQHAPFALRAIARRSDGPERFVAPTAAMNGTWAIVGRASSGIGFAIGADTAPATVRAMLFGYDPAGQPRWITLDGQASPVGETGGRLGVFEHIGGTPDGGQAATAAQVSTWAIWFHACDRASLRVRSVNPALGAPGERYPYETLRLVRLLPAVPCPASP